MDDKPSCCFRCSQCKKPDCDYDGDYVSNTEIGNANRQDHRAIWYRKTWEEIERNKRAIIYNKQKYQAKKNATPRHKRSVMGAF